MAATLDGVREHESVQTLSMQLVHASVLSWRQLAELQERIGRAHFQEPSPNHFDSAAEACERAHRLWQVNGEAASDARAHAMAGLCYYHSGSMQRAEAAFAQAAEVAEGANEPVLARVCKQNAAACQMQAGDYQGALTALQAVACAADPHEVSTVRALFNSL